MKRIYEAPSMLVQKINPVHIFAGSVLDVNVSGNATVQITENPAEEPDWFYTKESHSYNWEDSRW